MTSNWVWETQGGSRKSVRSGPSGHGCSSLMDMAIRSTLSHSFNITAESLEGLPWKVANLLWESLAASYAHFSDSQLTQNDSNKRMCTDS